jgi:hypothetical protein
MKLRNTSFALAAAITALAGASAIDSAAAQVRRDGPEQRAYPARMTRKPFLLGGRGQTSA